MRNIFDSDAQALVNPVNCVGVMGAGLAKQFKERYPKNFKAYKEQCRRNNIQIGKIYPFFEDGKWIINFPTKKHWKSKSEYMYIEETLPALRGFIIFKSLETIAMPMVGCGLGGLDWYEVKPMIENDLRPTRCKIDFYED